MTQRNVKKATGEIKKTRISQYLRFQLSGEDYAFDVVRIKEVLSDFSITPLPGTDSFLTGVINLRGSIIPIIDLRKKLKLRSTETLGEIIILEVGNAAQQAIAGAIVDSVKSVVSFDEGELEAPPKFGMNLDSRLIKAIAKRDELFVTILDSELLFSEKELWPTEAEVRRDIQASSEIVE